MKIHPLKNRQIHPLKTVGGAHHQLLPFRNKANRRNRRRRLSLPLHTLLLLQSWKKINFAQGWKKYAFIIPAVTLYKHKYGKPRLGESTLT